MNKKVLVIAIALAMLALPLSAVSATKPETITLTGTLTLLGDVTIRDVYAGKKPVQPFAYNYLAKSTDGGGAFTGGIEGIGLYSGSALYHRSAKFLYVGSWVFEEVTVAGRTGSLRLASKSTGDFVIGEIQTELWIESGTGELSSIRGRGTATPDGPWYSLVSNYEIEIQINP